MKLCILLIWLIFAGLFFGLGHYHNVKAKETMPKIEVKRYPSDNSTSIKRGGIPSEQRLFDFGDDFNEYIDNQNESNRRANLYAAYGYYLASLTALFSAFLSVGKDIFKVFRQIWVRIALLLQQYNKPKGEQKE
jgi:hypothetical protein